MRKWVIAFSILLLCCAVVFVHSALSGQSTDSRGVRASERSQKPIRRIARGRAGAVSGEVGFGDRALLNQGSTICIVCYDFDGPEESCDWQGWTRIDNNEQFGIFWHIDPFTCCGGGEFGGLVPVEGVKSWWCGVPGRDEGDPYLCSWCGLECAPGYGNSWCQILATDLFEFSGTLTFSFHAYFDSEPECDFTYLEYFDYLAEEWITFEQYDGPLDITAVLTIPAASPTRMRFRFESDGAWSDQDCLWCTDGAAIVDSMVISDICGIIDFEDCESAGDGDLETDGDGNGLFWRAEACAGYTQLYSCLRNNLYQDKDPDPVNDNLTCQIVFFCGSTEPSIPYPGLFDTPFCTGAGGISAPCQDERVVSPVIDLTRYSTNCDNIQDADIPEEYLPHLTTVQFCFDVYRDLPLGNCVFYYWNVRAIVNNCPLAWCNDEFLHYGPEQLYLRECFDMKDCLENVETNLIQVSLGCVDMCHSWYMVYCDCAQHTPSPWFDNVCVYRTSDIVTVLLEQFSSEWVGDHVEVEWIIGGTGLNDALDFEISRRDAGGTQFVRIEEPEIIKDGNTFTFRDYSTDPGGAYTYRVVVLRDGQSATSFEIDLETPAYAFRLLQNYPNPFNPATDIRFFLPKERHVVLDIFDVSGKRVRRLVDRRMNAGHHSEMWDGRDDGGKDVSSGIYLYRLQAGKERLARKCILMR